MLGGTATAKLVQDFLLTRALTDYLEVALPTPHRIGVDLAHVPTPISFLHVPDMQKPGSMVVVAQRYPRVLRDDIVVDR